MQQQNLTNDILIFKNEKFINDNPTVKKSHYNNKDKMLDVYPIDISRVYQEYNKNYDLKDLKSNAEKKRLEEENLYQNMLLNSVLNSSVDLIFYKNYNNKDGEYIGCNDAFTKFIGKEKADIIGHTDIDLFGKKTGKSFRKRDLNVIKKKVNISNNGWVTYPDGSKVLLNTMRSLLRDDNGSIIGILGISRDMTNEYKYKALLKRNADKQKELASIDSLTGINNRRSFFEISEKIFKISKRAKSNLSLLMIDIDFFKKVNDTYGHIIGDEILRYVADTIKSRLRDSDVFARYGGEEFIVLLPDTDLKGSLGMAEDIRLLFSDDVYSNGKVSIPITLSIGVCQRKDELLMRELIHNSDEALYRAKKNGRNKVANL